MHLTMRCTEPPIAFVSFALECLVFINQFVAVGELGR